MRKEEEKLIEVSQAQEAGQLQRMPSGLREGEWRIWNSLQDSTLEMGQDYETCCTGGQLQAHPRSSCTKHVRRCWCVS